MKLLTCAGCAALFLTVHTGIVLGTPLIQICYNGLSIQEQGIILVPAVLYQGFQIVFGQISVQIIKNWRLRTLAAAQQHCQPLPHVTTDEEKLRKETGNPLAGVAV